LRLAGEGGGILLIIDAKGERAATWYVGYGAERLTGSDRILVMPLTSFAADPRARGLL
jgi:hypothetical protein